MNAFLKKTEKILEFFFEIFAIFFCILIVDRKGVLLFRNPTNIHYLKCSFMHSSKGAIASNFRN